MQLHIENMMRQTAMYVPFCCGATICSFTSSATEEEIEQMCARMCGRTVIVVGGKSFPESVKKLYDGVGFTYRDRCKCEKECLVGKLPGRGSENASIVGGQYVSRIADNVFILQCVSGMSKAEIKDVENILDSGDVVIVLTSEYQPDAERVFRSCEEWKEEKAFHYAHGYKRKLCVFSYKKG